MRLVEVRLYAWGGAVGAGVASAHRTYEERLGTLVVLADDEGHLGLGEATPLDGFSVESHAEAGLALAGLDWAALAAELGRAGWDGVVPRSIGGTIPASVTFALETALGNLAARRASLSLCDWILAAARATDRSVSGLRDEGRGPGTPPLRSVLLGDLGAADVADRASRAVARGASSLKLKATFADPAAEARALARVRAVAGPEVEVRLNLNGGLDVETGRRALSVYAELGVTSVEEPTRGAGLLELGATAIPWLADESLVDASLAASLARHETCGGFVLKPTILGGIARVLALARSLAHGKSVVLTHAFEGPVALAAIAELSRAAGARVAGVEPHAALSAFPSVSVEQVEGCARPLVVRAASRPGLGLDLGDVQISRLGAPRFRWRAPRPGIAAGAPGAAPASLRIAEAARDAPTTLALVVGGHRLDFAALAGRARAALGRLPSPESRPIAFTARASLAPLVLAYAALEAGRTLVLLHPRWTETERAAALARSGCDSALTDLEVDFVGGERSLDDERDVDGPPPPGPAAAYDRELPGPDPDAGPDAVRLFTSGTTGTPRAVRLGPDALLASALAHAHAMPFTADDVWLLALPWSHIGGLSILTRCLVARRRVVVLERFDPDEVLRVVEREDVTLLSVVPAMLAALLARPDARKLARLRAVLVGGAPFSPDLRAQARAHGVRALATYGLTEASSQVATQRLGAISNPCAVDSGPPLDGVEVEVRDPRGAALGAGIDGDLFVRSPTLMRGYVGGAALPPGGWLDTGDRARVDDDGHLVVLGRADDTIVTGGENVEPLEVELALAEVPHVRDVVVFGVPDATWGELVAAVLVLAEDASLDAVLVALEARLAPFKRPRLVAVAASVPTTPGGKPNRKAARQRFAASLSPCGRRR